MIYNIEYDFLEKGAMMMVIKSANQVLNDRLFNKINKISDYIQFAIFEETNDPYHQNVTIILLDSTQMYVQAHIKDVSRLQALFNAQYINYEIIRDFNFY